MRRLEYYIDKDGEKLRCGYTTGSCAAGASKACGKMLLSQEEISEIEIDTPEGIKLTLAVDNITLTKDSCQCSVQKDAGDDPDVTDAIEIFSKVSLRDDEEITIEGGFGVGRISQKGIYGEVGDAAINPVPKEMIRQGLREISPTQGFDVEIFVPEGKEISKRTFNKNIGIVDGISIIGTKGIVFPMSEEALLKSIYKEIDNFKFTRGTDETIVLVPGNYGQNAAEEVYGVDFAIQCSNYIGKALKYAYKVGFRKFFLIGHVGKFSKLSMGAFDTHNEAVDLRMEAFVYYLALESVDLEILNHINELLTAEEAIEFLIEKNLGYIVEKMEDGCEKRIKKYLKDDEIEIKVKMYSMKRGFNFD